MKIGLSYSRCVRDIVEGHVDISDVLVIVARTDFDPHDDAQWSGIWVGYGGGDGGRTSIWSQPEWSNYSAQDELRFRNVSMELWNQGKLHQPRKFGAHPRRLPYYWLETVVADEDLENSPAVKDAWNKFQMVSGLASTKLKEHNE